MITASVLFHTYNLLSLKRVTVKFCKQSDCFRKGYLLYLFQQVTDRRRFSFTLAMCGFIAQLVEHRTSIAEVTGSNPVESVFFFRLLLSSCLNWKIYCDDHSSHCGPISTADGSSVENDHMSSINTGRTMRRTKVCRWTHSVLIKY